MSLHAQFEPGDHAVHELVQGGVELAYLDRREAASPASESAQDIDRWNLYLRGEELGSERRDCFVELLNVL